MMSRFQFLTDWCESAEQCDSNVLADTETGDKLSFNELVGFNGVGLRRC